MMIRVSRLRVARRELASSLRLSTMSSEVTGAEFIPTRLQTPEDVHRYWFADTCTAGLPSIQKRSALWFSSSQPEFNQVQFDNSDLIERVLNDQCDPLVWDSDRNPTALLAKVVVLDQFSRSVFRGTARAFAGDVKAANLVEQAVEKGWFVDCFTPIERLFLLVNLHHTEEMRFHDLGTKLAEDIGKNATSEEEIGYFHFVASTFLKEHRDVVEAFGRYPHRNHVYNRESTPDELVWLSSPSLPGWAKSQLPPTSGY